MAVCSVVEHCPIAHIIFKAAFQLAWLLILLLYLSDGGDGFVLLEEIIPPFPTFRGRNLNMANGKIIRRIFELSLPVVPESRACALPRLLSPTSYAYSTTDLWSRLINLMYKQFWHLVPTFLRVIPCSVLGMAYIISPANHKADQILSATKI